MGNIERQILSAAKEGAEGSGNSLGAHLMAKLEKGSGDPALFKEEIKIEMGIPSEEAKPESSVETTKEVRPEKKKGQRNRPEGNKRKMPTGMLEEDFSEVDKMKEKINHDLARLEKDRSEAHAEIEDIKSKIKKAVEDGEIITASNWSLRLTNAEDFLHTLEKTAPTSGTRFNETILKELHNYRKARRNQTQADLKINNGTGNERTEGDYIRARDEAFEISQKIEQLLEKKEEATLNETSPVRNDSIFITHEQELKEKKEWNEKHNKTQVTPTPEVVPVAEPAPEIPSLLKKEPETTPVIEPIPEIKVETPIVSPLHAPYKANIARIKKEKSKESAKPSEKETNTEKPAITQDALSLLESVKKGGVPAFISSNMRRIAKENGLNILSGDSPQSVIEKLRTLSTETSLHAETKDAEASPLKAHYKKTMRRLRKGAPEPSILPAIDTQMDLFPVELALESAKHREEPSAPENFPHWFDKEKYKAQLEKEAVSGLDTSNILVLTSETVPRLTSSAGETKAGVVAEKAAQESGEKSGEVSPVPEKITPTLSAPEAKTQDALVSAEKVLASVENFAKRMEKENMDRAANAKMSEKMLNAMRLGGEKYSKLSLKTKVAISLSLFAAVSVGGGGIASIAIGGTVLQRVASGLATFVGLEGLMKASAEKGGESRSEHSAKFQTGVALIAGFIVGFGLTSTAAHNVLNEFITEVIPPQEAPKVTPATTVTETVPAVEQPDEYIGIAEAGDSRWTLVERALASGPYADQFNSITSDEQRNQIINIIKNRLVEGMTEQEANSLNVGDNIHFKEVFEDKSFMSNAFTGEATHELAEAPKAVPAVETHHEINSLISDGLSPEQTTPYSETSPHEVVQHETATTPAVIHPNEVIETKGLRGVFHYSPEGKVTGFAMNGNPGIPDGGKFLNNNWIDTVRQHTPNGRLLIDSSIIDAKIKTISGYEQILDTLREQGAGKGPESEFLKNQLADLVSQTEKTYGDIFKKPEDFFSAPRPVFEATPAPVDVLMNEPTHVALTDPQVMAYAKEVVDHNIKEVFGTKGWFLGLGSTDGMKAFSSLADKPVSDFFDENVTLVGDEEKMKGLLQETIAQTNVSPTKGISVDKFLHEAAAINVDRFMNNA